MPLNLTLLDVTRPVSEGPSTINAALTAIQSEVNSMEGLLVIGTKTLKLTTLTSPGAGAIEAANIILTSNTGNPISVSPAGGASVFKVDSAGASTALKFVATGDDSNPSVVSNLNVNAAFSLLSPSAISTMSIDGALLLDQTNSSLRLKADTVAVSNANCGAAAASPLDMSKAVIIFLDYDNGAAALGNDAEVNIDMSTVTLNQVFKLVCVNDNATGMKLYNGTVGSEVFAIIDVDGGGIQDLAAASTPTFGAATAPATPPSLTVMAITVGGNKRLLIMDSNGVTW